jgi:hypothetical protein
MGIVAGTTLSALTAAMLVLHPSKPSFTCTMTVPNQSLLSPGGLFGTSTSSSSNGAIESLKGLNIRHVYVASALAGSCPAVVFLSAVGSLSVSIVTSVLAAEEAI